MDEKNFYATKSQIPELKQGEGGFLCVSGETGLSACNRAVLTYEYLNCHCVALRYLL